MLPGILSGKLVEILAQFLVFPEEHKRDERSGDRQNYKQHDNQLSKGHGVSLACVILVLMLERRRLRILQFVS
jgi:hypothetical protein